MVMQSETSVIPASLGIWFVPFWWLLQGQHIELTLNEVCPEVISGLVWTQAWKAGMSTSTCSKCSLSHPCSNMLQNCHPFSLFVIFFLFYVSVASSHCFLSAVSLCTSFSCWGTEQIFWLRYHRVTEGFGLEGILKVQLTCLSSKPVLYIERL